MGLPMHATVDAPRAAVKNAGAGAGPEGCSRSFTFPLPTRAAAVSCGLLALVVLGGGSLPAGAADGLFGSPSARTSPSLERQIDRARRDPAGTSTLQRRNLQDQLRQEPPGAERTRQLNTLDRLPPPRPATGPEPLPAPLPTGQLPTSIPAPAGGLPTSLPPLVPRPAPR